MGLGRKMLSVSAGDEQAEEADAGDGGNQRTGGRGTPRAAITVNDHVVVLLWCSYRRGRRPAMRNGRPAYTFYGMRSAICKPVDRLVSRLRFMGQFVSSS